MTRRLVKPEHKPRSNAERVAATEIAELLVAEYGDDKKAARIVFAAWQQIADAVFARELEELFAELFPELYEQVDQTGGAS